MATYAIGDIQGCFSALEKLLELISFHPQKDTLWFAGDLVNRGPQSLETLRFIHDLGDNQYTVLGNHDLHLLAVARGIMPAKRSDTFDAILNAPDKNKLIDWLQHQSLMHYDPQLNWAMVHAGLAPSWNLEQALSLAREVESELRGDHADVFLKQMYGNQPDHWTDSLFGMDRLRCITNYFTRIRFCYEDGRLEFTHNGTIDQSPPHLIPWFNLPNRKNSGLRLLFGHWAALRGLTHQAHCHALDTGCIWGNQLTAMRLEDEKRFAVECSGNCS